MRTTKSNLFGGKRSINSTLTGLGEKIQANTF